MALLKRLGTVRLSAIDERAALAIGFAAALAIVIVRVVLGLA